MSPNAMDSDDLVYCGNNLFEAQSQNVNYIPKIGRTVYVTNQKPLSANRAFCSINLY